MIIRINDKNGNNIAECDLYHHDIGIWNANSKSNISSIYGDIIQTERGFDDVIDIDIDNIIPQKQRLMELSLASAWSVFEVVRTNYTLDCSDDHMYASEIIQIPHTYGFIDDDTVKEYHEKLNSFLGWNGVLFDNDEYTYEEIDELIHNLNPIYNIRWKYEKWRRNPVIDKIKKLF